MSTHAFPATLAPRTGVLTDAALVVVGEVVTLRKRLTARPLYFAQQVG